MFHKLGGVSRFWRSRSTGCCCAYCSASHCIIYCKWSSCILVFYRRCSKSILPYHFPQASSHKAPLASHVTPAAASRLKMSQLGMNSTYYSLMEHCWEIKSRICSSSRGFKQPGQRSLPHHEANERHYQVDPGSSLQPEHLPPPMLK